MAKIFPTFENIERLKVQPTEGELFLLKYLEEKFPDDVEVYFQPFLNGDMPDIILLKKGVGATIIEVKDWELESYRIDENNRWHLQRNNKILKSPIAQVHSYRDNLYNLHINGLLEEKIRNPQFFGRIRTFVYFHKASRNELNQFYNKALNYYRDMEQQCRNDLEAGRITPDQANRKLETIKQIRSGTKIDNDLNFNVVGNDNLIRIVLPRTDDLKLFKDSIYKEFQRYLQPPLHVLEQGKIITYPSEQIKLIESRPIHQKIKGVAGSGKTAVLAKRAVNAHKRHNERVLILTYNITLINYIHDKISDIRDEFRWTNFYIMNYHEFFKQNANYLGIYITVPEDVREVLAGIYNKRDRDAVLDDYLEKKYYSNIDLFDEYSDGLRKYKTILIDEIQDYKPEWIKLIRKHFLVDDGEMVLFGDEKQNIYDRELDSEKKIKTVQGFGRWKNLNRSIRQQGDGDRIIDLSKKFQQAFFQGKYELDAYENKLEHAASFSGLFKIAHYANISHYEIAFIAEMEKVVQKIFREIRTNNIHPNDVVILSSRIIPLRIIDHYIRAEFNEKTITTFETKEMLEHERDSNLVSEIKNIRNVKKIHFRLNGGTIKISTTHSFKGFESKTIFLIINESDDAEIVYAGITRSKSDLMVFTTNNSRFNEFFNTTLAGRVDPKKEENEILEKLKDSIKDNKCIDLKYQQREKIVLYDDIKPYKILFMNDNFYLACEVNNKYKFMMFRISRIIDVSETDIAFYQDVDVKDFIDNIQTPFTAYREDYRDHLIDVIVEVDKAKASFFKNKQYLTSQKIIETKENGNLIVSFTVTQALEVEDLIKKWIPFVKVLEPFSLDEKIKSDIQKYLYE